MNDLSVTQAARAYSINPTLLTRLVSVGRIKAHKNEDGHWRIHAEALKLWLEKREERKRRCMPPKSF